MITRRKIAGGAAIVAGGHAAGLAASLVRNVIIARAIGVENFGIASTFLVTMSLLEMVADLSIDKLLVQAEDGDEPRLQAAAHAMNAARGLVIAALLALLAAPIAGLFDAPEATWAYVVLAVVPLLRGFAHLDPRRVQRRLAFVPLTIMDSGSQLFAVLLAAVAVIWLDDYSVALWVLIGQAGVYALASHLLAERAYRWSFDGQCWKRFAKFGWPLMLNGALIWVAVQGDRLLVGAAISVVALGVYSAAVTLVNVPSNGLMTVWGKLALPLLSARQSQRDAYRAGVGLVAAAYTASIVGVFAPLVFLLPWVVSLVYGEEFAIGAATAGWLVLAFTARTCRGLPALVALSRARTGTVASGNAARAALLPLLVLAATGGDDLALVAMALAAMEVLSLGVMWGVLLWRMRGDVPAVACALLAVAPAAVVGACLVIAQARGSNGFWEAAGLGVGAGALGVTGVIIGSTRLRHAIVHEIGVLRRGRHGAKAMEAA